MMKRALVTGMMALAAAASTGRMEANGWDKSTLKPGDVITATGYRFSDGQRILRLDKIVMAGGKEMFLYGRR
jgi:hypothetical protein